MDIREDALSLIKLLDLKPHPEGGYFKEIYRSEIIIPEKTLPSRYSGDRNISTSIYFLLRGTQCSNFHTIKSDEIWHFYKGSALKVYFIQNDGRLKEYILGNDISEGELPQLLIPAGTWFGAEVINKDSYALIGCTVSPGFDFKDFQLGSREFLLGAFPQFAELIIKLTS